MTAPAPVDPVQAAAPSVSLLSSSRLITDGARWENGLAWRPEYCITAQGFSPCGDVVGKPVDPAVGVQYYIPPAYRVRDFCTTLGGLLDEDRVRRQAEAIASFEVAQELWTGALTVANPDIINGAPHTNLRLASTDATIVVGTGTLAERLGQLEESARRVALGQQVFLHVPIHMITPIANLLTRLGQTLYTALGSVVVADAGYPGTGPAGTGTTWMYATGPVQTRLSTVNVEFQPSETINRKTNRQEIWADRQFAATFDPCIHMAMNTA